MSGPDVPIANADEFDAWNGESGTRWVARADERDAVLAPVADALMAAADPTIGMHVLDIGCGCGATTLIAARRVGDTGTATGLDLSEPMLGVAGRRAASAGARNAVFVHGDAQVHPFEPGSFDLVISRFGTMFFADPGAAFANIAAALRPGGRMCIATWQPLAANDWLAVPAAALSRHIGDPDAGPQGSAMFALADPEVVTATLDAAGFVGVRLDAVQISFTFGRSVDAALDYLIDTGPTRTLLDAMPDDAALAAALAEVRDTLSGHVHDGSVRLDGGIWVATASRPG